LSKISTHNHSCTQILLLQHMVILSKISTHSHSCTQILLLQHIIMVTCE
jgi:hypothetical protein